MKGLRTKTWRKDSSLFASTSRRRMAFHANKAQPQPTSHNDAAKAMGAMMRELGV